MVKSPGQGIFCQLYLNINKLIILKITFGNHFKFKKNLIENLIKHNFILIIIIYIMFLMPTLHEIVIQ